MKHLVLISTNGTVWDISLNENKSPSKKKLFELPNHCRYHGYSDDKGKAITIRLAIKTHSGYYSVRIRLQLST